MSNKKQRDKNRNNAIELKKRFGEKHLCGNCLELYCHGEGHFVPPGFGEKKGWYWCEAKA